METYDYIVVGAGSSGCAVTNRLVAAGKRVLLLEAGPHDKNFWVHVPVGFVRVLGTERSWIYETETQKSAAGRKMFVPQGRMLGGGSSINGMVYMRGNRADYDAWRDEFGCTGWGWDEVLATFKKSEGNQRLSNAWHNTEGPQKVSDQRYRHPISYAFVRAAQQAGLTFNDDFNGERQLGCGFYQTTTFNGRRASTAVTYLAPVMSSPNLTVVTDAHVEAVTLENGAASGISWRSAGGQTGAAAVREEVILAAGALATPKILMLSGIGPAADLAALGIPVMRDMPEVGKNYQDHLECSIYGRTKEPISLFGADRGLKALRSGAEYIFFHSGLLTSNGVESGAFIDTEGTGSPDIQIHTLPMLVGDVGRDPLPGHGMSINPCHIRPKSRGFMTIRSRQTMEPIRIEANYLSEQYDVDAMVRGIKWARKIMRQPALKTLIAEELLPSNDDNAPDSVIEAHVRKFAKTTYHPAGTCRMGKDDRAVVDPTLRVRGVPRLRVADASIMPRLPSGNTNAPSIMIGERCAEFILGRQ
jgi:choline dehydrogenase-like flavoprotein